MALPIPDKTWNKTVNVEVRTTGDGGQDRRQIMFEVKELFVNFTVPWVVEYSSSKSVAGTVGDNVDRWLTAADVSFGNGGQDGTSNISWIVLKNSSILSNFQIMIQCHNTNSNGGGAARITYSPADGYTGGSLGSNSPPSATDEIVLLAGGVTAWFDGSVDVTSGTTDCFLHGWQSSDGECTRIFAYSTLDAANVMHVAFEVPKNTIPEWTDPCFGIWYSASSAVHEYGDFNDASNVHANNPGGGEMTMRITCEGDTSAMVPQNNPGVNELSGDYEFFPMGLRSVTNGAKGRHGERFDLWWVPVNMINAQTVPLTPAPTREFAVFDDMLLVWDGSVPVII